MIDRVVLVTGLFRTGTSLVAAVVHRLGFQVAPVIPAPGPPSWFSDFEDGSLTLRLMTGWEPTVDELRGYLEHRRAMSRATGFEGRIALKSPYLALIWKELLEAIGEPAPFVIRTMRDPGMRAVSLAAHPALSLEHDERIHLALGGVVGNLVVHYELAVASPRRVVRILAQSLGVEDDDAIAAAAALIGNPTRYPNGVRNQRPAEVEREG